MKIQSKMRKIAEIYYEWCKIEKRKLRIKKLDKLELKVKKNLAKIVVEKEELDALIKKNKKWQRINKLNKINNL